MDYKKEFIAFCIDLDVLKFGEFTLKSGRVSPYFFNAGLFNSGRALSSLGRFYAQAIVQSGLEFDMLFGPAYKGIPLVVATAMALAETHQQDVPYAFDRKQIKAHGEGGKIVGAPLVGRVLIIDDVMTAGTAVRGAVELIREQGAQPVGVAISLDRQERGEGTLSAVQEVEEKLGLQMISIARLADLMKFVGGGDNMAEVLAAMHAYRERYGVGAKG